MRYFTMDPRDGGMSGSCSTCCCQAFSMRPGETDKIVLNYAPWTVPIGGIGLTQTPSYEITRDRSACSASPSGGFTPPTNNNYNIAVPVNAIDHLVDVAAGAGPAGNTFDYERVSLGGPYHGTVKAGPTPGTFLYTPGSAYNGRDSFHYKQTDAQGRSIIRFVQLSVGTVTASPTPQERDEMPVSGLSIDLTRYKIDERMQSISVPFKLGFDAESCEVFKVNIRQPARDCDGSYFHFACFDVHVGKC